MERFIGLVGLFILLSLCYSLSENRKAISLKLVSWGLGLQLILALLVLGIPAWGLEGPLQFAFQAANDAIISILNFTTQGSLFIFGDLARSDKLGFIFAFQVLPTIIFLASLMAVLYHLKIMQHLVEGIAKLMQKVMRISGAESLSVAANIFVGQTEAPLVIQPYINKMTRSELLTVMTGGMATVAGGVLAAYVGLLKTRLPDIAGHLLTASLMSAPAALAISKIILPETDHPETLGQVPPSHKKSEYANVIDAAASGASDGLKLAFNVGAMLLAFIALIALLNAILGNFGNLIGFESWGSDLVPAFLKEQGKVQISWQLLLGWLFAPFAFLMGIPWEECTIAGALLGEKIVLNEFVAYLNLSQTSEHLSDRTVIILSYALCGFANFSSIAIQIGGIGGIAPSRRKELAQLGLRSVIGGSFAAFMTATIAGLLI